MYVGIRACPDFTVSLYFCLFDGIKMDISNRIQSGKRGSNTHAHTRLDWCRIWSRYSEKDCEDAIIEDAWRRRRSYTITVFTADNPHLLKCHRVSRTDPTRTSGKWDTYRIFHDFAVCICQLIYAIALADYGRQMILGLYNNHPRLFWILQHHAIFKLFSFLDRSDYIFIMEIFNIYAT